MTVEALFGELRSKSLTLILCGAVSLLCFLSVVAYFYVLRPQRGTTEWISRLERQQFCTLRVIHLHVKDLLRLPLSILGAVALRYVVLLLHAGTAKGTSAERLMQSILSAAILAAAVYLLVRVMMGEPLSAICCALLSSLCINGAGFSVAAMAFSVLFLYFWMCAPYGAPIFYNALWLVASFAALGAALVDCFAALWMAPFWLGTYVWTQVLRWRGGDENECGKKLLNSLLLLLLLFVIGGLFLWLVYALVVEKAGSPVQILRSASFYREMLPTLISKLRGLIKANTLRLEVQDLFFLPASLLSLIPLLHGVFKLHNSRCLFVLLLVPCFMCMTLLSGFHASALPFVLCCGWMLCCYVKRKKPLFALVYSGMLIACCILEQII